MQHSKCWIVKILLFFLHIKIFERHNLSEKWRLWICLYFSWSKKFFNCCLNVRIFPSTSNKHTSAASQMRPPPLFPFPFPSPPRCPPQILLFQEDDLREIQISIPRLGDSDCNENWKKLLAQHEHTSMTGTVNEDSKTDTFLEPVFYIGKKNPP